MARDIYWSGKSYLIAACLTLLLLGITYVLPPVIERSAFLLLTAAVLLSAWFGGLGPGILSSVIAAVGGAWMLLPLRSPATVALAEEAVLSGMFILVIVLINSLQAARSRAEEATRRLTHELESRVVDRTRRLEVLNRKLTNEIQERARAEEALRASEMRFHSVRNCRLRSRWHNETRTGKYFIPVSFAISPSEWRHRQHSSGRPKNWSDQMQSLPNMRRSPRTICKNRCGWSVAISSC